jgi:hypothetical protein
MKRCLAVNAIATHGTAALQIYVTPWNFFRLVTKLEKANGFVVVLVHLIALYCYRAAGASCRQ